ERTKSRIEIPFGIVGGLLLVASLLHLASHLYRPYTPPVSERSDRSKPRWRLPSRHRLVSIVLAIFLVGPYVGMEISNFQLISTYSSHSYLGLDDQKSALTQSILAGIGT